MAYVALSRVRTLSGVHLVAFDPKSIMVSNNCIAELNRLRQLYRPDLPQYAFPQSDSKPVKCKLAGTNDLGQPVAKKSKSVPSRGQKRVRSPSPIVESRSTRPGDPNMPNPFKYNPVDNNWQIQACQTLGLNYVCNNGVHPGGPDVPLKPPNRRNRIRIMGDGNCLFRAMSHIITGSQDQHVQVRAAIIRHLKTNSFLFVYCLTDPQYDVFDPDTDRTIEKYIENEGMDRSGSWGSDVEMNVLAHMLETAVCLYKDPCSCSPRNCRGCTCAPSEWLKYNWSSVLSHVGINVPDDNTAPAMYIYHPLHPSAHFDVVRAIVR